MKIPPIFDLVFSSFQNYRCKYNNPASKIGSLKIIEKIPYKKHYIHSKRINENLKFHPHLGITVSSQSENDEEALKLLTMSTTRINY